MEVITKHFKFINRILARRYLFLLVALVAMLSVPSLFTQSHFQKAIIYLIQGLVLFAGIYAVQENKWQLYGGMTVGALLILVNWFGIFHDNATLTFYLSFLVFMGFYIFVASRLLRLIFRTHVVTPGVLYASINVYLLIGIIGGFAFMLVENAFPGSLNNLRLEDLTDPFKYFYFSFITLSTLGYGDITPVSPPAKSLAMILSTSGPIYLTVLVAMLVGRYITSHEHENTQTGIGSIDEKDEPWMGEEEEDEEVERSL